MTTFHKLLWAAPFLPFLHSLKVEYTLRGKNIEKLSLKLNLWHCGGLGFIKYHQVVPHHDKCYIIQLSVGLSKIFMIELYQIPCVIFFFIFTVLWRQNAILWLLALKIDFNVILQMPWQMGNFFSLLLGANFVWVSVSADKN